MTGGQVTHTRTHTDISRKALVWIWSPESQLSCCLRCHGAVTCKTCWWVFSKKSLKFKNYRMILIFMLPFHFHFRHLGGSDPHKGFIKVTKKYETKQLKTFFCFFLGQLAGGVILGVALWLRHDSQTSNLLILQFDDQQAPGTFYISEYTPIIWIIVNWSSGLCVVRQGGLLEERCGQPGENVEKKKKSMCNYVFKGEEIKKKVNFIVKEYLKNWAGVGD